MLAISSLQIAPCSCIVWGQKTQMGKEDVRRRTHVVVLPFPAQGHINPVLQFAKSLASKGLKVTLATTLSVSKSIQVEGGSVTVEPFSDGCEEVGVAQVGNAEKYTEYFESFGSKNLCALIERHNASEYPVRCLVYDSNITWALRLAHRLGLLGASFFTKTCAVISIYHHVYHGRLTTPVQGSTISLPGLPILEPRDLPSFVSDTKSYPAIFRLVLNNFSNVDDADLILFNTFNKLEEEAVNWVAKQWPNKTLTVGPTIPSMYLHKQVEGDKDYGLSLFTHGSSTYMNWLNMKETRSVVYISFGSLATIGEDQMEEIAWGLRRSGHHFLWVVRESEQPKLPNKFAEEMEMSGKGLVVTWCAQLEVLAHQAVGCFITHCGWNSTIEALTLGVPLIAIPVWTDQTTNAKFVEDIWKVGLRAQVNEKGTIGREEIEHCMRELMEGERGKEIKKSSAQWKALAKEAMYEGGSSDKNIEAFADRLLSK